MPVSKNVTQAGFLLAPLASGDKAKEKVPARRDESGPTQATGLVPPAHVPVGSGHSQLSDSLALHFVFLLNPLSAFFLSVSIPQEIRQLQQKQASYIREISDLQETIEWKDKKIGVGLLSL